MDLNAYDKAIRDSAERFAHDIGPHVYASGRASSRAHEMTVMHDDGLYRHLRFRSPDHSSYWFDLITVPGCLIFRGDGDSFVFSRTEDMFGFFRGSSHEDGVNPTYWSEKLTTGGRSSVMTYQDELFEQRVKEHVADAIRYGGAPRGIGKAVTEMLEWGDWVGDEHGARAALDSFEFKGWRFHDTWEWSFRSYNWWFLWACQAIVWGIKQYDAAKKPSPELAVAASS